MSTSAETLINELTVVSSDSEGDKRNERLNYNIHYIDTLDPDFCHAAIELLTTGSERERIAARGVFLMWLTDDKGLPAAHNSVAGMNNGNAPAPTVPNYILEYAMKDAALHRIRIGCNTNYDELHWSYSYGIFAAGTCGDTIVQEKGLIPRPDILKISKDELDRYFHPVAVASKITKAQENEEKFVRELPAFMEWVASAQDMDSALQKALTANSITPSTIEALTAMRETTIAPLHNGLI